MKPFLGVFGLHSEWTRDIGSAPVASDSAGLVANLANQVAVRYEGVASFNAWQYNASNYTVSALQAKVDLIWDNCQKKTFTPSQFYTTAGGANFRAVPIPDNAIPATGTDGELSIYQPASDTLWEFWKANKQTDGWHACWGGRIDNVSQSKGFFKKGIGVTASGLSAAAGSIGIEEAQALSINHAMSLNVVDAANWKSFSYPAQQSDGNQAFGTADAIEEGQRFRLDPAINVTALHLTPLAKAIALAAQKYGFIVNDRGGSVAVIGESGSGTAAVTGSNPWGSILGSAKSYNVLKNFPWSSLQALPLDYGM